MFISSVKDIFTGYRILGWHALLLSFTFQSFWWDVRFIFNIIPLSVLLEKAMAPHSSTLAWRILCGEAWWAEVHGVARSQTRLSDFTLFFHFHALEKEMATHSSVLAWKIPGTGEPGELPSMGSHRVGHDWSDLAAAAEHLTLSLYLNLNPEQSWISQGCFSCSKNSMKQPDNLFSGLR